MKYTYMFSEGNASMRALLGGKGANLAELTQLKLPVPHGFIISTESCNHYIKHNTLPETLKKEIEANLKTLQHLTTKAFGDPNNPLLVSVRSGAQASMPGMMDTVLNLGSNDAIAKAMAVKSGKLAYDAYRRLIQMYGDVVKEIPKTYFEDALSIILNKYKVTSDHQLDTKALQELVNSYKEVYATVTGEPFPQDPKVQLYTAIEAVFRSWNNPRAVYYRDIHNIPHSWGTAVTIQQMVFGNNGDDCATGVAFSRNPATGEAGIYGEYLVNAQGEDVVAGTHTPSPLANMKHNMPKLYDELVSYAHILEAHYEDMQDMEFTVENGKLYMLQTRNGKRTPQAAIRIAYDLIQEGITSVSNAVAQIEDTAFEKLLHPTFSDHTLKQAKAVGKGLAASPGAASGKIALTTEAVEAYNQAGFKAILLRHETSPDDIKGIHLADGILTSRGGLTSHAAVVTRSVGKPCIVGSTDVVITDTNTLMIGDKHYHEGDYIAIDGATGIIYDGLLDIAESTISPDFEKLLNIVDQTAKQTILANADTPQDIAKALELGAQGIGLIRTEHMFFENQRLEAFQTMILSTTPTQRTAALEKLLPIQRKDFEAIFEVTQTLPITVRLLDPPLHEFMPSSDTSIQTLANNLNMTSTALNERITQLAEHNPMMGHRGCRLLISHPEIAMMQVRALLEAAITISNAHSIDIKPKIMIPLVGDVQEFVYLKTQITTLADTLLAHQKHVSYEIGTMIELPRACILADTIAPHVDFFSFGTNDLTQMTYGFSRDDATSFIQNYKDKGIYTFDPFQTLDTQGVGGFIKIACEKGLKANPSLKIGVCGEHAGDPKSIEFLKQLPIHSLSCSPYRVPQARLKATSQ